METRDLLTLGPTAASLAVYAGVQAAFVVQRTRRRATLLPARPSFVSVLKPLAGRDDDLDANLESFASLDWPAYEVLLGLASPADPAAPVARAFVARHPRLARIVWTDPRAALNPKVAQLVGLTEAARGDVIVVSDSNVRASPDYLRGVMACLQRPGVGLVSSVVAGSGERTLGAMIENAQLAAYIAPAVNAAHVLGRTITVGKSMAMRRVDLARVGGWTSVGDVLAEDDVLGRRFAEAGFTVELSPSPVENRNVTCSIGRTFERHLRWAKMRRAIAPRSFAFEPLLSPIVISTLVLTVAPSLLSLQAWLIACSVQSGTSLVDLRLLRGRWPRPWFAVVELIRAHVLFGCWLSAWLTRRVEWRGHELVLGPGSKLCTPPTKLGKRVRAAA